MIRFILRLYRIRVEHLNAHNISGIPLIVRFLKIKDCREPFFINVRYKIIKNCSLSVQNMKLEGYFKETEQLK